MKHPLKSDHSVPQRGISIRNNLNNGNFADQSGKHFLITNQREAELAQKRLRRKNGAEEIKQNIITIAERKNLKLDDSNWKVPAKNNDSEKNI